ncbi:MAG: AAA family ATPase [Fusobacteriaceae bacterium]
MNEQIKDLEIENYKGIQDLKLGNLSKINILIGANNTKKTTILEAIYIGKQYYNGLTGITTANSRDILVNSSNFKSMFFNLDTKKQIKISTTSKLRESQYTITYSDYKDIPSQDNLVARADVLFSSFKNAEELYSSRIGVDKTGELTDKLVFENKKIEEMISIDYVSSRSKKDKNIIDKLNKVKLSKNKKNLIGILKQIDSTIQDLEEINGSVYIDIQGIQELIPLKLMGDGVYNLLDIALTITLENKIILIDEIENGMHYYALKEILKDILKRVDSNGYQLFITTHSVDTLNAIRDILKFSMKDLDISFINLKNRDGKLISKVYDRKKFLEKISEGWEIR